MIKVYKDSKIYVYCLAGHASGGAELLHQLVSFLRDNGKDAYIILTGTQEHKLHPEYARYNVVLADAIEDNEHNIEVLYEPEFYRAAMDTRTQKILWWLSVDNFYRCCNGFLALKDIAKWSRKQAFRTMLSRIYHKVLKHDGTYSKTLSLEDVARLGAVSAYQSEYAQNFLQNHGFKEMFALKDYINTDHCRDFRTDGREDIVLYNPQKGMEYTSKLISLAPDIKWVPIINMTRAQVIETMQKAKIYIDFGFHPGKDRLPRECAMNGLCIITGRRGAANFFEDISIEDRYKFDEKRCRKADVISVIRDTLANYSDRINDFSFYRYRISLEKAEFEQQIRDCFINNTIG